MSRSTSLESHKCTPPTTQLCTWQPNHTASCRNTCSILHYSYFRLALPPVRSVLVWLPMIARLHWTLGGHPLHPLCSQLVLATGAQNTLVLLLSLASCKAHVCSTLEAHTAWTHSPLARLDTRGCRGRFACCYAWCSRGSRCTSRGHIAALAVS